jgi:hypothetical protein
MDADEALYASTARRAASHSGGSIIRFGSKSPPSRWSSSPPYVFIEAKNS